MLRKWTGLLVLLFCLVSCRSAKDRGEYRSEIWVVSDLHYLSDALIDENSAYEKANLTSDGRIQECDGLLVDALVERVNAEQPDYLILTGDLTYNGEAESHRVLIGKLREIKESTKVLVIPGNHDLHNLKALRFDEIGTSSAENLSCAEFEELYADFGYRNALSRDSLSLSYVYALDKDTWALMLDTTFSRYNEAYGMNFVGGGLEEDTLNWVESILESAEKANKKVIGFSHHNLMNHNDLFTRLYTISQNENLLNLYAEYGVRLHFSGHLHIQNIASEKVDGKRIYDIASSSLLVYGNRFGRLKVYDRYAEYHTENVVGDEAFLKQSKAVFYGKYYDKSLNGFQVRYENYAEMLAYASEANALYFDGDYASIRRLNRENKALYDFVRSKTCEDAYLKSIVSDPDENPNFLSVYDR